MRIEIPEALVSKLCARVDVRGAHILLEIAKGALLNVGELLFRHESLLQS